MNGLKEKVRMATQSTGNATGNAVMDRIKDEIDQAKSGTDILKRSCFSSRFYRKSLTGKTDSEAAQEFMDPSLSEERNVAEGTAKVVASVAAAAANVAHEKVQFSISTSFMEIILRKFYFSLYIGLM